MIIFLFLFYEIAPSHFHMNLKMNWKASIFWWHHDFLGRETKKKFKAGVWNHVPLLALQQLFL
jgi:hypothetical protein